MSSEIEKQSYLFIKVCKKALFMFLSFSIHTIKQLSRQLYELHCSIPGPPSSSERPHLLYLCQPISLVYALISQCTRPLGMTET